MGGLDQSPMWGIIGIIIGLLIYFLIHKKIKTINLFFFIFFSYYIARVLSLTLLPLPLTETGKEIYKILEREMFNIFPLINLFDHFNYQVFRQCILNVIMFIPFGILLPLTFQYEFNVKKIFCLSLSFSVFIELTQLAISYFWIGASYRACDINDLIFNTVGGIIGYLLLKGWYSIFRKHKKQKYENIQNEK